MSLRPDPQAARLHKWQRGQLAQALEDAMEQRSGLTETLVLPFRHAPALLAALREPCPKCEAREPELEDANDNLNAAEARLLKYETAMLEIATHPSASRDVRTIALIARSEDAALAAPGDAGERAEEERDAE